jgi:Saxitoxin biosynthesis operon protein SxtJ
MSVNFHENLGRKSEVKAGSDRSFGRVMAVACGLVAAYGLWKGTSLWPYWLGASVVFAAVAWLRPALLAPLNRVWFLFGRLLHRVVNPIVMGVLFFVVFTPIGLLMRLFGKRPFALQFDSGEPSYWIPRSQSQPGTMTKQY